MTRRPHPLRFLAQQAAKQSIEKKLVILLSGMGIGCGILMSVALLMFELPATRERMAADRESLAAVASETLAPAMFFGDPEGALDALQPIFANPQVLEAWAIDLEGAVMASYPNGEFSKVPELGREFVSCLVTFEGEEIGSVVIRVSNKALEAYTRRIQLISLSVTALGLLLILCALRLAQMVITRPLLHLRDAAHAVTESGDYSQRVEVTAKDEIGALTAAFNDMLLQVEKRDAELVDTCQTAENAVRAKSAFLANMSHEIRTPMNGVLGMAQVLQCMGLQQEQKAAADTIVDSAEALLVVINDILDLSKLDAEGVKFAPEPHRVMEGVMSVVKLLRTAADSGDVALHAEQCSDLPSYLAVDVGRLRQILLNIIGNAVKFSPAGSVSIRVGGQPSGHAHWNLSIAVADTGIGIPKEKMELVFGAFAQADDSTTRDFGGTGLGLSISRRLVIAMGGRIDIESEEGVGSTFFIHLPLPIAEAPTVENQHAEATSLKGEWRVLLVEDNKINRMVARRMIEQIGPSVSIAKHGGEVINALDKEQVDVILMDCQMPVLDGFGATSLVRNHAKHSMIPIVALTAHSMPGYHQHCIDEGMDDYLAKPFKREELASVLATWLGRDREGKDLAA